MAGLAQRGGLLGLWTPRGDDEVRDSPRAGDGSASCGSSSASSPWELVGTSCASFGDLARLAPPAPWELDAASWPCSGGEPPAADAHGGSAVPEGAAAAARAPPLEWYPCDSMELDAVAAQEMMRRADAERASALGSSASAPGRPSRCSGGALLPDVAMSLESFLEEEVPAFPFSRGTRCQ
ncbi:unnamed protein product [Prorocentrum cordatum]|uniref:Cysteine protease n=1 Tax=Prorocentrum cordatum TaxID=2364126 RepID=A0ABN9T3M8_9DINO|nr:unnamed protein product [Polarella glacialis]